MVDRYWRKIEDVENDIENSMQISSILLKLKGYDKKLGDLLKIGDNENNISSNLGIINTNKSNIASNSEKISTNEGNISSNSGKISTNEGDISSNSGKISTNEGNISSNSGKISTNEGKISANSGKLNDFENNMKIKIDIYNKTFIIPNMSTNWSSKLIFDITTNSKFTTDGIIKINAIYNYSYDKNYNFSHVYSFYNNGKNSKEFH